MKLYHGTNIDFDVIDLQKSHKNKDFGCSQENAMDLLYNSKSYAALLNTATGLYFQSTAYFLRY